jgi:hypothetical protein
MLETVLKLGDERHRTAKSADLRCELCKVANDSMHNPHEGSALSSGRVTHRLYENLLTATGVCHFDETLTRRMLPGAIIQCLRCILRHTNINGH